MTKLITYVTVPGAAVITHRVRLNNNNVFNIKFRLGEIPATGLFFLKNRIHRGGVRDGVLYRGRNM